MTAAHSYWSASRFEQRMLCAGSAVLELQGEDSASAYAAEGTAAHQVLTWAGQQGRDAHDFLGMYIYLDLRGRVLEGEEGSTYSFLVDRSMAEYVQSCLDYVREVARGCPVLYDVRLNYASYLDVPEDEAWGTGDVIILLPDEIVVVDFKYGMGVQVSAGYDAIDDDSQGVVRKPNPQMACYGLGALSEYADFGNFKRARLVISQPRITDKPSEYDLSVEELEAWGRGVARDAVRKCQNATGSYESVETMRYWEEAYLNPGEKQCKFCKAKATCPALRNVVAEIVLDSQPATPDEFAQKPVYEPTDDAGWLSVCLNKVDLIEDWCKGVRAAVEAYLLRGTPVPEYKLVQGKQGNRAWKSAEMAEQLFKSMRLKIEDMYDLKLISPTSAEKLVKSKLIGPRQWSKVQGLITRSEGKAHVAHVSDPRPALVVTPVAEDFTDVTNPDQGASPWNR